jgi:hypothetical protein
MAVEVAEQMMDVLCCNRVAAPFLDIEGEQRLVGVQLGLGVEVLEVLGEVCGELLVEILAEKVGWEMSAFWGPGPAADGKRSDIPPR